MNDRPAPSPTAAPAADREAGVAEQLVQRVEPDLAPILEQGITGWLGEKIESAVEVVVERATAPVREIQQVLPTVRERAAQALALAQAAAERIARGDCGPIEEAGRKIEAMFDALVQPVIDAIQPKVDRVKQVFNDLWAKFGAPVWEFLQTVGGEAWAKVQRVGQRISAVAQKARAWLASAWTWVQEKLGLPRSADGEGGFTAWVKEKAGAVWREVLARVEPVKKPLMVAGGVLLLLSPMGPMLAIGAAATGVLLGVRWMRDHLRARGGIAGVREEMRTRVLPALREALDGAGAALRRGAAWVEEKLRALVGPFGQAAAGAAGTALGALAGAIGWVADKVGELVEWASGLLQRVVATVTDGFARFRRWIQPVLDTLKRVATAVTDLMQLPALVLDGAWRSIPECVREPLLQFLMEQILSRVPFFAQIKAAVEVWLKLRNAAMEALKDVFVRGDIAAAARRLFHTMLDVLGVPTRLVTAIFRKAASFMDLLVDDPIGFLKNVARALLNGLIRFKDNVLEHLIGGFRDWLFGELGGSVELPADFSLGAILKFVLSLLNITTQRVLDRIAAKLGPEKFAKLQRALSVATGVWSFMSTLMTEGPAGLWRDLKEKLADLWGILLEGAVSWMMETAIKQGTLWLAGLLDPTGIMAVVNSFISFYRAVESFMERLTQILQVVESMLDSLLAIAQGSIGAAAAAIERVLARSLPVVIAFIAKQAGLGNLARRVGEMMAKVQLKIDEGIDWLIDKALRLGAWIFDRVQAGVGAVKAWAADLLGLKREFTAADGKTHTVSYDVSGDSPRVMMRSEPVFLREKLRAMGAQHPDYPAVEAAQRKLNALDDATRAFISTTSAQGTPKSTNTLKGPTDDLLAKLSEIPAAVWGTQVDIPTAVTYSSEGYGPRKEVVAAPLTRLAPASGPQGSRADNSKLSMGYELIRDTPLTNYWVAGHLLHGRTSSSGSTRHLHGSGEDARNLYFIDKSLNGSMSSRMESEVVKKVHDGATPRSFYFHVLATAVAASQQTVMDVTRRLQTKYGKTGIQPDAVRKGLMDFAETVTVVYRELLPDGQSANAKSETFHRVRPLLDE